MTRNSDTEAAWRYHNLTKHSPQSIRADRHFLDWSNQPYPFKIYASIEPITLPRSLVQTLAPALEVAAPGADLSGAGTPDLARLASILYYSAGVTKHKTYPGGELYFRAAACAGALYPTEIYVACAGLEGLPAGVYHFNPGDFALRKLREGDLRGVISRATGGEPQLASAPVILIYTSISWRSTWKYRDRAYRYHFWDNGMIVANALAMSAAHQLGSRLVMGFVESEVNKLIGIDGQNELALSLLALGHTAEPLPECPGIGELPEISFEVVPISRSSVDYPSIREMHAASSFVEQGEVTEWRNVVLESRSRAVEEKEFSLAPEPGSDLPNEPIEDVIQRRASTRRFAHKSIPLAELAAIVRRATEEITADCMPRGGARLNDIYAIVNRVEGLPAGAYFVRRDSRTLELLREGEFSENASFLTLEQDLGGDACVTFFMMADLNALLEEYGNRGYRIAQMESGIIGGRMYLAAYALKRGATGLTFYDDDVTEFFSPHAAGKSCMLVMSVGIPGKRPLY